ncbi:hypothetical protein LCGC14_3154550 [marine sediment metagenome]|uniref:Uncharacterized protein n=1 Tax=marine sediment metagenome TaxID=412755 RepID=A0A0F8YHJ7_9ZZZZ
MQKTECDLCGKEITEEKQLRYVRIVKLVREFSTSDPEEKPDMPEKEICSICGTRVKDKITELKHEMNGVAPGLNN